MAAAQEKERCTAAQTAAAADAHVAATSPGHDQLAPGPSAESRT